MILTAFNAKGGVGKTTTAINLSAGLAARGKRVLLVDLDSQSSASLGLGVLRTDLSPSAADVLMDGRPVREAVRQTAVDRLDLLTGSPELANADLALVDIRGRESHLKTTLQPIRKDYDFVVIDSAPSLSLLTVNALVAADWYVVPVEPHYLALEGLVGLMAATDRIRRSIGLQARLLGILLTRVDYRQRVVGEIVDLIRQHYGDQVFQTEVRVNVRLTEAPSFGKTIFDYDSGSTGADAYRRLADEVLDRIERTDR